MRYVIVDAGNTAVDAVVLDGGAWQPPSGCIAVASDTAQIGWAYDPVSKAFSAPVAAPTPYQVYQANIAKGIAITSTATPALDATYALDSLTLTQVQALATDCAAGLGFPNGATTFSYPDINAQMHSFASGDIINLYKAMRALIFNMQETLATLQKGGTAAWPAQTATIA